MKINEQLLLVVIVSIVAFIIFFFVSFYHKIIPAINNPEQSKITQPVVGLFDDNYTELQEQEYKNKYIEPICPDYKPNGGRYRECLINFLKEKEEEANSLFEKLSKELPFAEKKTDDPGNPFLYGGFIKKLSELNALWIPYRDKFCEAKNQGSIYGTDYIGILSSCKLYETDKYINLLHNFEKEWIWESLLNNLYVPAKYSELCGAGRRDECPEFYFVNGELPAQLQNNVNGSPGNAYIGLNLNGAVAGVLNSDNNEAIKIAMVPYFWCWASCGTGVYVVQQKKTAEVIAIIEMHKDNADKIEIKNNIVRLVVDRPWLGEKPYIKECYFEDGKLEGDFLKCHDIDQK